MKGKIGTLFRTFSILIVASLAANAQEFEVQLSNTYYIENVNIVQKPGQMMEMGSIIIKDGIIQDVGKNLTAPADAQLIKADSMYVYPGFIDAYNNIGVKKSEEEESSNGQGRRGNRGSSSGVPNPGNPPNDKAGILPDRRLADVFDPKAKSTSSWREAGFTASMSSPKGGMLPGQANIILHSSKDASTSILKEGIGVVGTFENASRMYPATIIGVMAKYRDLYRKASYALSHENAYKANPVGMTRPAYDKSLRALYPVTTNDTPLYFEAEKLKDISRVFALQKDLGFTPVLMNVKQGGLHADQIIKQRIPLILSLDVPHSEEKKKESKAEKGEKKEDKVVDASEGDGEEKMEEEKEVKEEEPKDPEMEALKARKEKAIVDYQSQAAMFVKKGVNFAFSGKDIKVKDLKKNLKAMMEHGISEDQILAALTTTPAQMYGVSNVMGTVEKGKLANIFVSTAPYFEDDAKIKYVFVEGKQFEYEIKEKKKKSSSGETADISGLYEYTVEIPGDTQRGTISLKKDGDSYSIIFKNDGDDDVDNIDASDVETDGNSISFPLEVDNDGFMLKLTFDLSVDGDDMEGSVTAGQFGTFPMTGEKIGDPEFKF